MAPRTKAVPPKPVPPEGDAGRRYWDWEADGNVADGAFVGAGEGFTAQGKKSPFITLRIDGTERDVWAHNKAMRSKIKERIEEHGPIEPGERVIVRRNPDMRTSEAGFDYYPYSVEFPDLPQKDQADLFGARGHDAEEKGSVGGGDDTDIPFMPT
jgi:hypothetical protein